MVHHFEFIISDKFDKPPHVSNYHQNVIWKLFCFHITFSYLLWKAIEVQDIRDAMAIFYSMYSTLIFCSYLEFDASQVGLLTWLNLEW